MNKKKLKSGIGILTWMSKRVMKMSLKDDIPEDVSTSLAKAVGWLHHAKLQLEEMLKWYTY